MRLTAVAAVLALASLAWGLDDASRQASYDKLNAQHKELQQLEEEVKQCAEERGEIIKAEREAGQWLPRHEAGQWPPRHSANNTANLIKFDEAANKIIESTKILIELEKDLYAVLGDANHEQEDKNLVGKVKKLIGKHSQLINTIVSATDEKLDLNSQLYTLNMEYQNVEKEFILPKISNNITKLRADLDDLEKDVDKFVANQTQKFKNILEQQKDKREPEELKRVGDEIHESINKKLANYTNQERKMDAELTVAWRQKRMLNEKINKLKFNALRAYAEKVFADKSKTKLIEKEMEKLDEDKFDQIVNNISAERNVIKEHNITADIALADEYWKYVESINDSRKAMLDQQNAITKFKLEEAEHIAFTLGEERRQLENLAAKMSHLRNETVNRADLLVRRKARGESYADKQRFETNSSLCEGGAVFLDLENKQTVNLTKTFTSKPTIHLSSEFQEHNKGMPLYDVYATDENIHNFTLMTDVFYTQELPYPPIQIWAACMK